MKTILVTGGTGYIGSHTAVELQAVGYDVIIADNLVNSTASVIDRIERISNGKRPLFIKADLSNETEAAAIFDNNKIDGIINFAAFKAVGESCEKPIEYYRNNLQIAINMFVNMKKHGIKYFVQSSSCTVYGEPDSNPISENTPPKFAVSPYGNTKQMVEDMLQFITQTGEIKAIALRYFNPVGAHPTALIGELPNGIPNNLMPYITQTAAGIRKQLTIFGNNYPTPDGTCIRDYIHVVDLAKAHVVAMDRFFEHKNKANFEAFNIGTGNGFSVLDIIKSFEKTTGIKLNYCFGERRAGDVVRIWADTTFAEKELGWKAELSIDEMTLSAWHWQQQLAQE
ncbi:MAG: UDP-glucose 4-epimerase GalE [Bacteroidales bacterium]|jgi:UDP-glucose 4-epimerase|nr:UDP-glucose 4-epimerase GalE [Bacteroidales bacterium]